MRSGCFNLFSGTVELRDALFVPATCKAQMKPLNVQHQVHLLRIRELLLLILLLLLLLLLFLLLFYIIIYFFYYHYITTYYYYF